MVPVVTVLLQLPALSFNLILNVAASVELELFSKIVFGKTIGRLPVIAISEVRGASGCSTSGRVVASKVEIRGSNLVKGNVIYCPLH